MPSNPQVPLGRLYIFLHALLRLRQFEAEQQMQCLLVDSSLIFLLRSVPILVLWSTRSLACNNDANQQ